MKKLFFDDVRQPPDLSWIVARDVPEAKLILSQQDFDVVSLDHDIGYAMMCSECVAEMELVHAPGQSAFGTGKAAIDLLTRGCTHTENGTNLANWMVDHMVKWPNVVIIHSANPYASVRMRDILNKRVIAHILSYDKVKALQFQEQV